MDWRMISVLLSVIQFVFVAVIFAVIKFNDLKHLDSAVETLRSNQTENERVQTKRHEDNQKAMQNLAEKINTLYGRCNAIHNINEK